MICKRDIPFIHVQPELIDQLNSCQFTYHDYIKMCTLYDDLPTYWNFALYNDDNEMVAFVWGTFEPLDQFMHILRISVQKDSRKIVRVHAVDNIKKIANSFGAKVAIFITDKPEIFLANAAGLVEPSNSSVVEIKL